MRGTFGNETETLGRKKDPRERERNSYMTTRGGFTRRKETLESEKETVMRRGGILGFSILAWEWKRNSYRKKEGLGTGSMRRNG